MTTEFLPGFDGAPLAVHRLGEGRPVLLLHGLFSSAEVNWIKYGTARRIAEAGLAAIMPDLRAHGQSAAPHDPAAYPADVLVRDLVALVDGLGLTDFDLCGFSLGARTALKGVAEAGVVPRRLILSGMGLAGIRGWSGRIGFFLDAIARFGTIPREDPAYFAQAFMKSTGTDLVATRLLLESFAQARVDDLSAVTMPTLLLCGTEDDDNGSAEDLAAILPNARYAPMPGTHMTSVTKREFGEGIVSFLSD
ncbi:alpha/beta fold hydrolase [Novosphingobium sp.]|uniref:alpha/beta fold hydrolase n=1 Tax=Novosphingobium sp. TaxID=1874826 RepID=UPI00261815BC|nr:alpha/beta fold hydrolase [Novosphingobium sp.]